MARVVTVEELEALADESYALWKKIDNLPINLPYDVDACVEDAAGVADQVSGMMRRAVICMQRSIASARTDAEADKADAKRKDV